MVNLQFSVEESLRDKAQAVAENIGIDLERAVRHFLTLMVQKNDLPFEPSDDPFYSPQNQAHLREILDTSKKGILHIMSYTRPQKDFLSPSQEG